MSATDQSDSSFGEGMKHKLVEDFAVAYLNGSVKPNLAERNPTDCREIQFLMDAPQFGRTNRMDIWSYSDAIGTGYQYRVTYKDKRFSDLDNLLSMYMGRSAVEDGDKPVVEQKLYDLVLLLMKESRLPKSFRLQSTRDVRLDKFLAELEQLKLSLEAFDKRVKKIEEIIEGGYKEPAQVEVQASPSMQ